MLPHLHTYTAWGTPPGTVTERRQETGAMLLNYCGLRAIM